ncbi:hypothetical protein [Catenulispora rubra]|jgi:hypothetical protein|uniref:hypothetical protein n=1 Tax=Catenulispora rubra TaxID=280293 RepID=UPI001892745E|nr:hypothetical protein [Catenulispora rubra]
MRWTKKGEPPDDDGWYYCVKHGLVEPAGACAAKDRLGPYATQEEAEHALQRVQERNEAWRKADEAADADS